MADKGRLQTVLAAAAAAVICGGAALFGVGFYRHAPREIPSAEIVHRQAQLPEVTMQGGKAEDKKEEESSSSDSSREDSRPDDSVQADVQTVSETSSSYAEKPDREVRTVTWEYEDEQTPSPEIVTAPADADTPVKTVEDGTKADREYFTTSIRDGEKVEDSTYFFTVTHLVPELEVVRCDVELDGAVLTGDAGRLELKEGENRVRVSCTYKDSKGRVYRAFRDYTLILESAQAAIFTDLTDCTVYYDAFTFYAECDEGLEVRLNGVVVEGGRDYNVTLGEGENMIRLSSGKNELNFSVTYIPVKALDIVTDLTDCAVYGETLGFGAQAVGGKAPKLMVQVNGVAVKGSGGAYTAVLNEGENLIRLLAKDGTDSIERSFRVTRLPEYDEALQPYIESISLTDNMTVKGSTYTLTLTAADHNGERIYSGGIELSCGGEIFSRSWEDVMCTGYLLHLHQGENSICIKLTDHEGRQSEFWYTLFSEGAQQGEETGRIAISCRADVVGLGLLCEDADYPVLEGESGFDTVERFLNEHGYEVQYKGGGSSRYLCRISAQGGFAAAYLTDEASAYLENSGIAVRNDGDPDSLGEFDYTSGSGWIYSRNGKKPSYAMSSAVFDDGDIVELMFSLDLGNDIRGGADE